MSEQHNTFWFKFGRLEHRGKTHSDWKSVALDSTSSACTPDFEFPLVISMLYSKTQDKDKIKIQREFTSSTLPSGSLWLWILGRCPLPGVSSPGDNVIQQGEVRSRRLEERVMLSGTLNHSLYQFQLQFCQALVFWASRESHSSGLRSIDFTVNFRF